MPERSVTVEYLAEPSLPSAAKFLEQAIAQKDLVIIIAECSVEYEGRGASRLGSGDRLIVIKPDGAVLVHRPTGYSPVNWQPESQVINVELQGGSIVIHSVRKRPREVLDIRIQRVYSALRVRGLTDKAEFIEYMDEAEIADYIARHPEIVENGLRVIKRERRIGEGYADIIALDKENRYVVIEVKRVTAGEDAVKQLYRYVEELRKSNPKAPIRGVLVAPAVTKDAHMLLNSLGLEYRRIDIVKLHREARKEKRKASSKTLLEYLANPRPRERD